MAKHRQQFNLEVDEATAPMWQLLIEWNGIKPGGGWYNVLHSYGLYSRKARFESPDEEPIGLYEWRATQVGDEKTEASRGIVLQEGLIVVTSHTLAKELGQWAQNYGAYAVFVGHLIAEPLVLDASEREHFDAMKQAVSKRGPKREDEKGTYVVTCFDCVKTSEDKYEMPPVQCTDCGGSNIQYRFGKIAPVFPPEEDELDDVMTFWRRARFINGLFEITPLKRGKHSTLANAVPHDVDFSSPILPDALQADMANDVNFHMHVLDVLYAASLRSEKVRMEQRWSVLYAYGETGSDEEQDNKNFYSFRSGIEPDIVDMVAVDRQLIKYL